MNKFTRANVKSLRTEIQTALNKIGKKHNILIDIGGSMSFDADSFGVRLKGRAVANKTDADKSDFEKHCRKFGMVPAHFGRIVKLPEGNFEICGIKPRGRKYPILVRNGQGKSYKISEFVALNNLIA